MVMAHLRHTTDRCVQKAFRSSAGIESGIERATAYRKRQGITSVGNVLLPMCPVRTNGKRLGDDGFEPPTFTV